MKIKRIAVALTAIISSTFGIAQSSIVENSLLLNSTQLTGSARTMSIGGAMGALGGDISSASLNPAGLGMFNRSSFSVTPSIDFHEVTANVGNEQFSDFRLNANINQIGVVFNDSKRDFLNEKFKGHTFAFNISRVRDYQNVYNYQGASRNSIVDFFLEEAAFLGEGPRFDENNNQFTAFNSDYAYLAFENYLIGKFSDFNIIDGRIEATPDPERINSFVEGESLQNSTVSTKGSHYSIDLSWGANYDDKVFFGAAIGFQTLRYRVTDEYREFEYLLEDGSIDDVVQEIRLNDQRLVTGNGVNLRLGAIFKPADFLNLGISYQTPTLMAIDEENDFNLSVTYGDYLYVEGDDEQELSAISGLVGESRLHQSSYTVLVPGKITLGGAFFFGKYGFVSADLDYINYQNTNVRSDELDVTPENNDISANLGSVWNYRVGGELRLEQFRLRAGYNRVNNPFNNALGAIEENVTFGLGFRNSNYFVDLTTVLATPAQATSQAYSLTNPDNDIPVAQISRNTSRLALTFGINF